VQVSQLAQLPNAADLDTTHLQLSERPSTVWALNIYNLII
jgi:hypothetical protein